VAPASWARNGALGDAQVKHRYEPYWPKRLDLGSAFVPPHSALISQPNVGTLASTSLSAPVNRTVETGSTANTSSCEISCWTAAGLFDVASSRFTANFSLRPSMPPEALTMAK
jgi:hypothetical protein